MHASGSSIDAALSRAGFLIVDDKPFTREMACAALAGRSRSVRQASSVDQAIELLTQPAADIDCVIADWDLLPVGGLELLRMIRCRTLPHVDPRMSFVIFTARSAEAAAKCAVDLDANGYAATPLSADKLVRTVSGALTRTWLLQGTAHYASVPGVVPPPHSADPIITPALQSGLGASRSSALRHVQPTRGTRAARMCGLKDVEPGAILARDLRDVRGALLLRTGTPLDPAMIDRLLKAAGPAADRYQVWVRR